MTQALLLCAAVFVALYATSEAGFFDCRRAGQDCQNSQQCNYATGVCACVAFSGLACEQPTASITTLGVCAGIGACLNGGSCYDDAGAAKCLCTAQWTGPKCERLRARVDTCDYDGMTITIEPYGAFTGRIAFMKGSRGEYAHMEVSGEEDTGCAADNLMQVLVQRDAVSGSTVIRNKQTCVHREDDFPAIGKMTVEVGVSVQYNQDVWGDLDDTFELRCVYAKFGDKTQQILASLPSASPAMLTQETLEIPVTFTIVNNADVDATTIPNVKGDQRFLKFVFSRTGAFKNFIVDECTAHATASVAADPKLLLVQNKCFTRPAAPYFKVMTKNSDATTSTIQMEFTVFKFKTFDDVNFTCRVHLCRSIGVSADGLFCEAATCAGPTGYGRRRRNALEDKNGADKIVTQSFTVLDKKP